MRLLAILLALALPLLPAPSAHADIGYGSFTCQSDEQAKVEVFAAGVVTIIVNGRYSTSWAPRGHYRMVFAASGASREHYAVLNEIGWPILVVPYCGSW